MLSKAKMFFKFVFICLFLAKNSVSVASIAFETVDTTPEEFPYVAFTLSSTYVCPAALITENYLIAPAFCVFDESYVKVYLGNSRLETIVEENTQIYNTSDIFIHEDIENRTSKHYLNNIALIKLEQPVILSDKVQPGKLISIEPNVLNEEHIAQVIGWFEDYNTVMQVETVELLNQTKCVSYFGSEFLKNQELCTMSGSPQYLNIIGNVLTVNKKIAGFQVHRYECTIDTDRKCYQTQIFLNIAPFLYWISQNVGVPIAKLTESNSDSPFIDKINGEKLEKILNQIDNTNDKLKKIDNKLEVQIDNMLFKQEEYISNLKENSQNYNELKENIKELGIDFNDFLYKLKYSQIKIEERYIDIISNENRLSNEMLTVNKNIDKILELLSKTPKTNYAGLDEPEVEEISTNNNNFNYKYI